MRVDIEMPTGSKAELAKRLFAHVENKGTDLAPDVLEIDQWEYRDPELARRERREIFGRFPVVAAHGSELANPRDFVLARLPKARDRRLLLHAEHEHAAPAGPLPAAHVPAAPQRSGALRDADQTAHPGAGGDRRAAGAVGQEHSWLNDVLGTNA